MVVLSFIFFLCCFLLIGFLSFFKKKYTNEDYLLAGRNINPWLISMSAFATNASGYMFIGMIAYTYAVGLSTIWFLIGWIFGHFISFKFIVKPFREVAERENALSFSEVLSRWNGNNYTVLRLVSGFIILIFLGTYAAAQLNAGSKALNVLFGWNESAGAVIGAVMVFLYCFSGGIRASIWTDAAQSIVMFFAMIILLVFGIDQLGSVGHFWTKLHEVSPTYMNIFPSGASNIFGPVMGPGLFIMGWVFGGLGLSGQPHIMVRFMAMDKKENLNRVCFYYYSLYIVFFFLTIAAGLVCRLLLPYENNFDAETALPLLATYLLPSVLVGFVLAGLFASSMSTADSQILSCSASITHDLFPGKKVPYWMTKLVTLFVVLVVLLIALMATESVFRLVMLSWSALATSFVPLLIIYILGEKPSEKMTLFMIASGLTSIVIWQFFGLNWVMYDMVVGLLVPLILYWSTKNFIFKS